MAEKITQRALHRIVEWLEERTRGECPFCGASEWTVDDELASLPALQHQDPHVQLERGHSMVLVTCEQCGFTANFAAKKIRVE